MGMEKKMPKRQDINKILIIGSGPIIIGQACEFDYSGTQACKALKKLGYEIVLVNSNPATIMTDKHMADKIYIEPLTLEVVKRVIEIEKPDSVLSNLGGQTALTLSMQLAESGFLAEHGVKLLGSNPETIHKAEDRQAFKDTMEEIGQPCIPSKVVETLEDAMDFAEEIGYPVIVRPAFTLGGTGGGIAQTREELHEIATNGLRLSPITQIGKGGVTDNLLKTLSDALEAHEIIKVNILATVEEDAYNLAENIADLLDAVPVAVIGRKAIFYRRSSRENFVHLEV